MAATLGIQNTIQVERVRSHTFLFQIGMPLVPMHTVCTVQHITYIVAEK